MATYKNLKSESYIEQNISFAETLLNTTFQTYGKNKYSCFCPFHNDREDSFRAYVNKRGEVRFHCFGECKGDWDIYDIIKRRKNCSFREAQQEFAGYVGEAEFQTYSNQQSPAVDTSDEKPEAGYIITDEIELEPECIDALNDAADFYNSLLFDESKQFAKIVNYLGRRGIDRGLIRDFRIGFSPAYNDEQFEGRALIKNNLESFHEDYREFYPYNKSGLVRLLDDETSGASKFYKNYVDNSTSMGIYGEYGDFFAGRITFPVYDRNGCIQGLIGRRPDNRGKLRWVKQQAGDTGIRPKVWLYGIDKAAAATKRYKTVILVEGIFDYFAFYKLFQNKDMACVVSTLGTKLTDEGRSVLEALGVQNFIVAYDWDDAGRYAIKKAASEIGATVYYLGGMAEDDDPAISLKNAVNAINGFSLSHLMSAAKNIQDKTEKPVFFSHITTGPRADREIILKPDTCLENEAIPKQTQKAKEYVYEADQFLPLLTYDHGNKAALDAKIETLIDMLESKPTETAADNSFMLPVNFVEDSNYTDLGPALIFWLRIAIEQQRRKRKIRESDATLAGWLKTSRATIIKYKKMLLEDGYLNSDTSRKIQRLSVNYFPK
ncbi:toprim domain-containing protein [Thermodesulfobacteriota bacterium]